MLDGVVQRTHQQEVSGEKLRRRGNGNREGGRQVQEIVQQDSGKEDEREDGALQEGFAGGEEELKGIQTILSLSWIYPKRTSESEAVFYFQTLSYNSAFLFLTYHRSILAYI
jgi:hypothetical protein